MGRGSSSAGGGGAKREAGSGIKPGDVISTMDFSEPGVIGTEVANGFMNVAKAMTDEYGETGAISALKIAKLKASAGDVLAYYDGANIAVNEKFMNNAALEKSYADCVKSNYHPPKGNMTAAEAVAAHEYGHALTDAVAKKLNIGKLDDAATKIVKEARKAQGKHKGVVQMASKISKYATSSNAEAVAEAFSDVFCNGNNARAESLAIVSVVNGYLK